MNGVARAATVSGEKELTAGAPAQQHLVGQEFHRPPVKALERAGEPARVVAKMRDSRSGCERDRHLTTSWLIHFRLYQRSSSFSTPCRYMPISSRIASSTVFFGLNPVVSRRSELIR